VASQAGPVSGLAQRYANALLELAEDQKALDTVADDLRGLRMAIDESDDLRRLVGSPVIRREDQARAVDAVMVAAGVAPIVRNFVGVVARHHRLFALRAMIDAYLAILAARRGEVTADVTAAHPLAEEQKNAVTEALRQVVGGKVSVNVKIDPSLLGGLVVKVGSRMFDSSLRTKLQRLQLAMKGVG